MSLTPFDPLSEDWPWSSAAAHVQGRDNGLVEVRPMLSRVGDWAAYLSDAKDAGIRAHIFAHSRSGRPLGDERFVQTLERITGRVLTRRPPGRKKEVAKKQVYYPRNSGRNSGFIQAGPIQLRRDRCTSSNV